MTSSLVSVVVPTRDRTDLLAEALASIRAIEGPDLILEIIVGDNSPEQTARTVAERFGAVYVPVSARGASAARNAALHSATGEFIAFLDDDDLWLPEHIRPHLDILAARPDFGAVIGQVINTDNAATARGLVWPDRLPPSGDVRTEFFRFQPQIGATVVRARVAREVGDFDPTLIGDQDWDWHLRLAARTRVGFIPRPMILFRQRPAGADTRLSWIRLGFATKVISRNALRMPAAIRPNTLRAFVALRGTFSFTFREAAKAHLQAGDLPLAMTALRYSFVASPPHFLVGLARDRASAAMLWRVLAHRKS